ncbi:MAG: hypothetical protein Q8O46_04005 [bacterium]|nr:hypothetical protein [bacterium]
MKQNFEGPGEYSLDWKRQPKLEKVPVGEPAVDPFKDFDGEVPLVIRKDIDRRIRKRIRKEEGFGDPKEIPPRAD